MIGFRADANDIVATGHMMRCITIARQLKKRGEDVCFFIADHYAVSMLKKAEMDYVCLHTEWDSMEEELPVLLTELTKKGCDKVLVDSYQATPDYLEKLSEKYKTIYIDDMFESVYPVNMVINYNAYHIQFPYREVYENDVKLLLGTVYVPLREEFSVGAGAQSREDEENNKNVLLSCGGGDTYQALIGILAEAVKQDSLKDVVFHTIVGRFNKNYDGLKALSQQYDQIKLYCDVNNMAQLMSQCKAAVSAAGTMLFELCAMQVPTVFFVCADNQKYDSDFFEKNQIMLFAGDIRDNREACVEKVCDKLAKILQDKKMCNDMKGKLHEVTDGNGAARIAEEIINL